MAGYSAPGTPLLYLSGNVGWNQTNPAGDQYLMARTVLNSENGKEGGPVATGWRRATPLSNPIWPITAEPVGSIEASILPIVGALRGS
jgi:hypothetical protein